MRALLLALAVLAAVGSVVLLVPRRPVLRAAGRERASPARQRDLPMLRLVAAAALAAGLWAVLGGGLGLLLGGGSAVACWVLTGRLEPAAVRRRRERIAADLPHVVDLLSACLAAGHSPATAVDEVRRAVDPPVREELDALHARLRLGVDPVGAWRDLSRHPQLGPLGRTVARAVESGASVSDAMLRLGEDLRARNRAEVEARARAVGVKAAVPLGVCLLPAFVLVGVVPLVAGSLSVLLPR